MTRDTELAALRALKLLLKQDRGDTDNAEGWEVREQLDRAIAQLERECPSCRTPDGGYAKDCPELR